MGNVALPPIKKGRSSEDNSFNEWLSGIVDGTGTLLVSSSGDCSCEITTDKNNEHTLMSIKNKLGGSIKSRSSSNSYRYRLHHRSGMTDLLNRINGNIRNSKRVPQLMKVCSLMGIPYIPAMPLTTDNAWTSGFFDGAGTISAKFDSLYPTVTISIPNNLKVDVEPLLIFNGSISYSKSGHGHPCGYVWSITRQSDINNMLQYFKLNPSRSHKLSRIHLVNKFYSLLLLKAHQQPIEAPVGVKEAVGLTSQPKGTSLYRAWTSLESRWLLT
jgi:hypothetical protein